MILPWGDHFGKRTVWSLIYFLNYNLLSYLAQSQILVISLYIRAIIRTYIPFIWRLLLTAVKTFSVSVFWRVKYLDPPGWYIILHSVSFSPGMTDFLVSSSHCSQNFALSTHFDQNSSTFSLTSTTVSTIFWLSSFPSLGFLMVFLLQ